VAVGGRRVVIVLAVRRLFCNERCQRRTFAEQVEGLTVRYGRRTPLLRGLLEQVAVALTGRAGARLTQHLHVPASRSTLLRLLALPDPEHAAVTPRVLGVDDFALRRGQVYGTVLIDCQSGKPVELLAGREAQPLAAWLTAHAGVEVICRDRSGAYAEGARLGAPEAVQVADRFHMWQNLSKAVERCVARHCGCLRPVDPEPSQREPSPPQQEPDQTRAVGRFAERAFRHHALVHELLAQGHGIRAITRHLGWGHHTVQRYARAQSWQELVDGKWQGPVPAGSTPSSRTCASAGSRASPTPPSSIGRSEPWALPAATRWSATTSSTAAAPEPMPPVPPSVRQVTGWLTHHPDQLTKDEHLQLKAILQHCPELRAAAGHIRSFGEMLTKLEGHDLPAWIAAVRADADGLPGLGSFAAGLEHDLDAVTRGLTTHWSSGPIEGRVNHIKMIKRQMFGRASLPLLRNGSCSPPADSDRAEEQAPAGGVQGEAGGRWLAWSGAARR
jgi:transposase